MTNTALLNAFLDGLAPLARERVQASAALGERLAQALDRAVAHAEAAWPKLAVDAARYGAFLAPRDRTLLRYRFVDGLNVDPIGVVYRVHRATATRWVAKAREELHGRMRGLLMERLALSGRDFESVMRLMESHLEVTLSHLGAATPTEEPDD